MSKIQGNLKAVLGYQKNKDGTLVLHRGRPILDNKLSFIKVPRKLKAINLKKEISASIKRARKATKRRSQYPV